MAGDDTEAGAGQQDRGTHAALTLELRRLRESQGLTQHEMARRLGLSARSAIADYESGRRKPPTDILAAYEGVFDLEPGALRGMRDRGLAEQAQLRYASALAELAPSEPAQASAPAPPAVLDNGRNDRDRVRARRTLVGAAALVLICTTLAGSAAAVNTAETRLDPTWSQRTQNVTDKVEPTASPEPMDGDDPRARDCYADATTELTAPMYLPGSTGGKTFGTLRPRHSTHCGASWGSAYYSNPNLYTIRIIVHRPADGAEILFDWADNTPPGSYSDMLSTDKGCVWIEAEVITPKGTSAPARTGCEK